MEIKDIIIFTVVLVFVGIRLYQKYLKKNQPNRENKPPSGMPSSTSGGDDDYEPYSKKQIN